MVLSRAGGEGRCRILIKVSSLPRRTPHWSPLCNWEITVALRRALLIREASRGVIFGAPNGATLTAQRWAGGPAGSSTCSSRGVTRPCDRCEQGALPGASGEGVGQWDRIGRGSQASPHRWIQPDPPGEPGGSQTGAHIAHRGQSLAEADPVAVIPRVGTCALRKCRQGLGEPQAATGTRG